MQARARCLAARVPIRERAMTINQCVFKAKAVGRCLLQQLPVGEERKLLKVERAPTTTTTAPRNLSLWSWMRQPSACDAPPPTPLECPKRSCNVESKGWFSWLFGRSDGAAPKTKDTPIEPPDPRCCRKRYYRELKHPPPDPDLSEFGGQAYKTCGVAYVVQRDRLQPRGARETREDRLLRAIETHPDLQARMIADDPVADGDNLCARLVQMADLRLHPLYRKIAATPLKEGRDVCTHVRPYRPLTGPLDERHLPARVGVDRAHLERKNLYWRHKNIAPPADFRGRIMEFKPRQRPVGFDTCAAPKRDKVFDAEVCRRATLKRDAVFDSLEQTPTPLAAATATAPTAECKDAIVDRDEMVYHPTC